MLGISFNRDLDRQNLTRKACQSFFCTRSYTPLVFSYSIRAGEFDNDHNFLGKDSNPGNCSQFTNHFVIDEDTQGQEARHSGETVKHYQTGGFGRVGTTREFWILECPQAEIFVGAFKGSSSVAQFEYLG
jgi:hypothetical protein